MTPNPSEYRIRRDPVRIQRRRTKGWRMPDGAVYVGRPSRWANPYRVDDPRLPADDRYTREQVVELFWRSALDWWAPWFVEAVREELAGKDLACWCKIGDPCHADVLLELANGDRP